MLSDTGPMVAMILRNDQYHTLTLKTMESLPDSGFVTTWSCLTEALYLLGRLAGWQAQDELLDYVEDGSITVYAPAETECHRIRQLMKKYHDTPMDFADASLIAAAESLHESNIFTFDHHFHVYRLNDHTSVNVVP